MPSYKAALLTLPKTGSQWIRDVLSAPQLAVKNGFILVQAQMNAISREKNLENWKKQWKEARNGCFFAPVYNIPASIWREVSSKEDRAVVVLRDPRDMVVSWMYSQCYSHEPNQMIDIWRNLMLSIPLKARMAIAVLRFDIWTSAYVSWAEMPNHENVYVTSYEAIVKNQETEFSKIVRFLGWNAAREDILSIISEFSFFNRSGRKPGDMNPASHYRKGVSGDWKNHFDQKTGKFFESLYPGLLRKLGYEVDDKWYQGLKEEIEADEDMTGRMSSGDMMALQSEIDRLNVKLQEEMRMAASSNQSLIEALQEKEEEIQRLALAVNDLQSQNSIKDNEINDLYRICEDRLNLIERLNGELKKR